MGVKTMLSKTEIEAKLNQAADIVEPVGQKIAGCVTREEIIDLLKEMLTNEERKALGKPKDILIKGGSPILI